MTPPDSTSILTGPHIQEVLLRSFPTEGDWRQLVSFALDESLPRIAVGSDLTAIAYRVCLWAQYHGRLGALLTEAHSLNPHSPALAALVTAWRAAPPAWIDFGPDPTIPLLNLAWATFQQVCAARTQEAFEPTGAGQIPYTPRLQMQAHIDRFLQSTMPFLVIVGDSGLGKTCVLNDLVRQLAAEPDCAILGYQARSLLSAGALTGKMEADLTESRDIGPTFRWHLLDRALMRPPRTLVILIDGLNESNEPAALLQQIESLLRLDTPWLKVILTCRPHIWQRLQAAGIQRSHYYQPPGSPHPFVELGRFTVAETAQTYERYRGAKFRGPPFDRLAPALRRRFADPLVLWLVAEIYTDRVLPPAVEALDVDLVPLYVNRLCGDGYLSEEAVAFLQDAVGARFLANGCCATFILREAVVTSARNPAAAHYLEQLLKVGLLIEGVTGVGANAKGTIRFRYERFQEYYLGTLLVTRSRVRSTA